MREYKLELLNFVEHFQLRYPAVSASRQSITHQSFKTQGDSGRVKGAPFVLSRGDIVATDVFQCKRPGEIPAMLQEAGREELEGRVRLRPG